MTGAGLNIGKVSVNLLLNRIIIDDVLLYDKSGEEMLKVTRLAVRFDLIEALQKKISIGNVQLFGFDIRLSRENPNSEPNFQFLLDAFASKDSLKSETMIDLRVNSLLARRGKLSYDVLSEDETPGKFNAKHIGLHNIIGNISLKSLKNDSVNAHIKRLSFNEQSGLELKKLSMRVLGNQTDMRIENFAVELPQTSLQADVVRMNYDSLASFKRLVHEVRFSFMTLPSYLTLRDLSPFIPAFAHFKERIKIEINADGTVDRLNCSRLRVDVDDYIHIGGDISFEGLSSLSNAYMYGKLSELSVNREGTDFLFRNFSNNYKGTPGPLTRLGNISFQGEVSGYFTDFVTYGRFQTDLGVVKTDLKLSSDREKGRVSYSGTVQSREFELGVLTGNNQLGKTSFDVRIRGQHGVSRFPAIVLKGLIADIEYSGYRYENITLDGEYKYGGFNGNATLNDKNGRVNVSGEINLAGEKPTFDFHASVKNVRPHDLKLTSSRYKDTDISLTMDVNFTGGSINEMLGKINIDSISFVSPKDTFFIDTFNVTSTSSGGKKKLVVDSDFLKGKLEGIYSYQSLPISVMNILSRYVPAVVSAKKGAKSYNDFNFDFHLFDTEFMPVFFDIPLRVLAHSTLKGYLNDSTGRMRVEGFFPSFQYGGNVFESGMILCENPGSRLKGEIRIGNQRKDITTNYSLIVQAKNDTVDATFNWGNNSVITYGGKLSAIASFSPSDDRSFLKTVVTVNETDVILNDAVWKVHPSKIFADSGKIHIDNFYFSHQDQYARVNGYASKDVKDTINVDIKDLNVGYLFDMLNLKRSVDFAGLATGNAYLKRGASQELIMRAKLFIKDFSLNNGLLGDADVEGEWHPEEEGIYLSAKVKEGDVSDSKATGYIYPLKPKSGLDLDIQANQLNIQFLEYYLESIVGDVRGRASGRVHFFGAFNALNLEGAAKVDASVKVNVLNTSFAFNDSIRMSASEFSFNNIGVYDLEGHHGIADGWVKHQNLKNFVYRLNLNPTNMLVMNTRESSDLPFYGTVYGSGNVVLWGDMKGLNANIALVPNRNSTFVYIMSSASSAVSNRFITFTDRTPQRNSPDSEDEPVDLVSGKADEQSEADIRLNIMTDANPEATVKIILDPIAGDFISGKGTGNIRTEYYNKGEVKMFGNYQITQGVYKFSLQEVIRKDFLIKEGSYVVFNGDPMSASLNIQAVYTVNSASLNDLIPENPEIAKQPNVKVNCIINITGTLTSPVLKLNIELPNERDEIQTLVRNYISSEEEMNTQIIYLLGIGKFYTPDYVNRTQNSNVMPSVLSSTLSGQFNNMLSQITNNNNNWNIGTNISTGDRGWTDVEVEGILSGQLLNNRLLINGNFGYRESPLATTNFTGDFETELLLTRSGDIRLKGYNQTNDRYYMRSTNFTTQGLGIMYKKDFSKWGELLFWRKKKKEVTK